MYKMATEKLIDPLIIFPNKIIKNLKHTRLKSYFNCLISFSLSVATLYNTFSHTRSVQNLKVDENDRTRIILRYSRGWALVLEITFEIATRETTITRLRVKIDAINLTIINTPLPFRSFPTGLITTFDNNSLHDVAQRSKVPDTRYLHFFVFSSKTFLQFPQFPGFSRCNHKP